MNNTRFLFIFGICASLLFLAACVTSPTTPTETLSAATPRATLTPSPNPSLTQTPKPTLTRTSAPTNTPEPSITPDIIATVIVARQPRISSPLLSPDGKWRAEVIIHGCVHINAIDSYAYAELRLTEIKTGIETVIDTQLANCGGLGAYGLAGLLWSLNSRYFYYTQESEGVFDGCSYWWEQPITRLNLASQTIEQLGRGPWSPDKSKIATWELPWKNVVIWDVDGGEFARVAAFAPDANVGPIAWSPNSRSLVYLQSELDCYPLGKTYIVSLDLSTLEQTLLLESDKPSWSNVTWESPDQLDLFDENSKEWRYNLITKKLEMKQ